MERCNGPLWVLGLGLLLFSAACSRSEESQQSSGAADREAKLEVLETFNVGQNVYVRSLKVDSVERTLWVGTSTGVLEVDLATRQVRNTFTRKDGLANEYVFAIGIDQQGYKWFGTNAGGASKYKDGIWRTYFPMHGLADYWVYSFAPQGQRTLWVGTWAGVNRVDIETGRMDTFVEELVNEWVYGIAVDSKDNVWFGTEGGVTVYDGAQWRSWTHEDGLGAPNKDGLAPSKNTGLGTRARHDLGVLRGGQATYNPSYIFSILCTQDDSIWAGTWGAGVSHYDGSRWENYTRDDGLSGDIVYSIEQDPSGALWFGTNGGVTRFDGANWISLNRIDGLPGGDIYALAVDPMTQEIWIGVRGGVARIRYAREE